MKLALGESDFFMYKCERTRCRRWTLVLNKRSDQAKLAGQHRRRLEPVKALFQISMPGPRPVVVRVSSETALASGVDAIICLNELGRYLHILADGTQHSMTVAPTWDFRGIADCTKCSRPSRLIWTNRPDER